MKSSSRSRSKQAVTYMEVYGTNRVLYRVTASNTHRNQKLSVVLERKLPEKAANE